MTSYREVTNSVYPATMTTIRHCSILEFGVEHPIKQSPRALPDLCTPLGLIILIVSLFSLYRSRNTRRLKPDTVDKLKWPVFLQNASGNPISDARQYLRHLNIGPADNPERSCELVKCCHVQGRIKGGTGELPRALRSKGAFMMTFICFKIFVKYSFEKLS